VLTCPHCGQALLTPQQSRLFDAVRREPLTSFELTDRFNLTPSCIRAHMWWLRKALKKTEWTLSSARPYGYLVRKR